MLSKELTLLIVDDDEVDRQSIQRGFKKAGLANPIFTATNGCEALALLQGQDGVEPMRLPVVVLLDLNMPRMNGLEFLERVRKDERLTSLVVFVLTTSVTDQDIWEAYSHRIAGYCLKSAAGDNFLNLITMLEHYWRIVELPARV